MMKNNKIRVEANGSVELEQIVRENIEAKVSEQLEVLAKTYYRDITVDINISVK